MRAARRVVNLLDCSPRRTPECLGAIVLAIAVLASACGGAPADGDAANAEDDALAAGDTSELVVPLDYLQGEWCNSDGEAWVFDGETARFGESHDELIGEVPVALALGAGSERLLISQSDDEFVVDLQSRELTFTRGRC